MSRTLSALQVQELVSSGALTPAQGANLLALKRRGRLTYGTLEKMEPPKRKRRSVPPMLLLAAGVIFALRYLV